MALILSLVARCCSLRQGNVRYGIPFLVLEMNRDLLVVFVYI